MKRERVDVGVMRGESAVQCDGNEGSVAGMRGMM
jgi:hypothetical protein